MEIDDILLEWSYRLKKGYPTMENGQFTDPVELQTLQEILQENGINEIPSFVNNKTPVSDVIKEEESDTTSVPERVSKKMLYKAIDKLDPDQMSDAAIRTLYGKIRTFLTFKPLRAALTAKGFPTSDKEGGFDMPKKIANELQQMLISMKKEDYDYFVDWIDPKRRKETGTTLNFPPNPEDAWGNLITDLPDLLSKDITKAFSSYAGQDEKGRGVGMGEILMTLVFDNIEAAKGGGDLALTDGTKLEVKGSPAVLGALSKEVSVEKAMELFKGSEITFKKAFGKPTKKDPDGVEKQGMFPHIGDKELKKSALGDLISHVAKKDLAKAEDIFVKLLEESGIDKSVAEEAAGLVGVNWTKPVIVNRGFALANFIRYASGKGKEPHFGAFLAMDYGKQGKDNGDYVYVTGTPSAMAEDLMKADTPFKGASLKSMWPRVNVAAGKQPANSKIEDLDEDYV